MGHILKIESSVWIGSSQFVVFSVMCVCVCVCERERERVCVCVAISSSSQCPTISVTKTMVCAILPYTKVHIIVSGFPIPLPLY